MRIIRCDRCHCERPLYAINQCQACYLANYRARPAYKQQRKIYDVRYTLKILYFEANKRDIDEKHKKI